MDRVTSMTAFTTVVTAGSFAAAAQRLSMSPAMVTNHVRSLEEHLGARLLNRTTRKLSLTEAGKAYFDQAALILAQIEAADSSVAELHSKPRGILRLNAATILSHSMAPLIGGFSAAYPEVTVDLTTTDRMVDLVEDGIDVAIRFNQAPDSSLIVRRLGQFSIILCAAPSYLETHGTPREPSDLSRHNCLAYTYRGFDRLAHEWRLIGPEGEVTVPVSGNLQTNSLETLLSAAYAGRGLVMVTSCAAVGALRSGHLVQILPEYNIGEFPIIALYPHRQHVSAKVRAFLDYAGKHFAESPSCPDKSAGLDGAARQDGVMQHDGVALAFMKPRRLAI
ncbi:MAG TPA: LysR substrate-binding domain-containing protein [Stellaceae bacterium]